MKKIKLKNAGFTLVELVIVIAIVIVLSVVSVPIYRSYVDKAKYTEGYALLGTILSAQKAYYSENGNFYNSANNRIYWTDYNPIIGIDARGNKYFTSFTFGWSGNPDIHYEFFAALTKPSDLQNNGKPWLEIWYNITTGGSFIENNIH